MTFTTTSSPVLSCAACTCATDAEARGSTSKRLNTSLIFWPSCSSISAIDCCESNGGTRSCSSISSSAMSSGNRSRRVERICPNLMKIGPKSCNAKRRLAPRLNGDGLRGNQRHGST